MTQRVEVPTSLAGIESHRVMIVRSGDTFGMSLPYPHPRLVVLSENLALVTRSAVSDAAAAVRPTATSSRFAVFTVGGVEGTTGAVTQMAGSGTNLWSSPFNFTGGISMVTSTTASNSDGTTLAFAINTGLLLSFREGGETRKVRLSGQPVRVFVRSDDTACAVIASGRLQCDDGSESQLRSDAIAAAEPLGDGRIVLVTTSGSVLEWNGGIQALATTAVTEVRAVRVSPSGGWVAIIGADRTDVIEVSTGQLGGRHASADLTAPVSDVAFIDELHYVVAYTTGAVAPASLDPPETMLERLRDSRPRELTPDEVQAFQVDPALVAG